jgi:hypothetical protein
MSCDRKHLVASITLFLGVLAIVVLRAPEMVLLPSLLFDEGSKVFAHFYENREAAQILRFKSGYLPLLGNVIGYVAVRLPTRLIPYGFVGSAVVITSFTYSLFFARPFRRWLPSDLDRGLICLVFALAPISDCLLVTMSDYSLWNLLAALILLTAWPPSKRTGWRYLHGIVCNLLVWAHPLALLIAPLAAWRAFKSPGDKTFYRVLLFNLIAHQIFGVAGILTTHGLWDHGTGVPIEASLGGKLWASSLWTIEIIAATAFRTAFGSSLFESSASGHAGLLVSWTLFLAIAGYFTARKVVRVRSLILFLTYLIVTLTFLSCFLRFEDVHGDPMEFISHSPRYIYLQSLSFLLLFGTVIVCAWEWVRRRLSARPIARWLGPAALLPLLALLFYYYLLNIQLGYGFVGKTQPVGRYYDPDPRNGLIVKEFFENLASEERRRNPGGIELTASKINDWPITIDTTAPPPPMNLRLSRRGRVLAMALGLIALGYLTRRFWMPWLLSKRELFSKT